MEMREIKFRAKMIDSDEWVYGGGVWIFKEHEFKTALFGEDIYGHPILHIIKSETIGGFTGLHDKNDKEIWEGDIVKYWRSPICRDEISDVKYINPQHLETETGFWPFINFNGGLVNTDSIEVIGNIYENPELIENK